MKKEINVILTMNEAYRLENLLNSVLNGVDDEPQHKEATRILKKVSREIDKQKRLEARERQDRRWL